MTIAGARGELGIGGAVVHDSTAARRICRMPAQGALFHASGRRPLELIETLRYVPGEGFTRLALHLARMAALGRRSSASPSIATPRWPRCKPPCRPRAGPMRVRLTLNEAGAFAATAAPLADAAPTPWRFAISPERVVSTDLLQRHKTDWRELLRIRTCAPGRRNRLRRSPVPEREAAKSPKARAPTSSPKSTARWSRRRFPPASSMAACAAKCWTRATASKGRSRARILRRPKRSISEIRCAV